MPITAQTLRNLGLPGSYPTFIETGYYKGQGVAVARAVGFQHIYSIESDPNYARAGWIRTKRHPRTFVIQAESPAGLLSISKAFRDTPCVFWLDAHEMAEVSEYCPLLDELEIIHQIILGGGVRNHTVLIDDRRLIKTGNWKPLTEEKVLAKLGLMFPGHRIAYLPGHVPEDIIAAIPDSSSGTERLIAQL